MDSVKDKIYDESWLPTRRSEKNATSKKQKKKTDKNNPLVKTHTTSEILPKERDKCEKPFEKILILRKITKSDNQPSASKTGRVGASLKMENKAFSYSLVGNEQKKDYQKGKCPEEQLHLQGDQKLSDQHSAMAGPATKLDLSSEKRAVWTDKNENRMIELENYLKNNCEKCFTKESKVHFQLHSGWSDCSVKSYVQRAEEYSNLIELKNKEIVEDEGFCLVFEPRVVGADHQIEPLELNILLQLVEKIENIFLFSSEFILFICAGILNFETYLRASMNEDISLLQEEEVINILLNNFRDTMKYIEWGFKHQKIISCMDSKLRKKEKKKKRSQKKCQILDYIPHASPGALCTEIFIRSISLFSMYIFLHVRGNECVTAHKVESEITQNLRKMIIQEVVHGRVFSLEKNNMSSTQVLNRILLHVMIDEPQNAASLMKDLLEKESYRKARSTLYFNGYNIIVITSLVFCKVILFDPNTCEIREGEAIMSSYMELCTNLDKINDLAYEVLVGDTGIQLDPKRDPSYPLLYENEFHSYIELNEKYGKGRDISTLLEKSKGEKLQTVVVNTGLNQEVNSKLSNLLITMLVPVQKLDARKKERIEKLEKKLKREEEIAQKQLEKILSERENEEKEKMELLAKQALCNSRKVGKRPEKTNEHLMGSEEKDTLGDNQSTSMKAVMEYIPSPSDYLLDYAEKLSTDFRKMAVKEMVAYVKDIQPKMSDFDNAKAYYILSIYLELKISRLIETMEKVKISIMEYHRVLENELPEKKLYMKCKSAIIIVAEIISQVYFINKVLCETVNEYSLLLKKVTQSKFLIKHSCDVYDICEKVVAHQTTVENTRRYLVCFQKDRKEKLYKPGGWLPDELKENREQEITPFNKAMDIIRSAKDIRSNFEKYEAVKIDLLSLKNQESQFTWLTATSDSKHSLHSSTRKHTVINSEPVSTQNEDQVKKRTGITHKKRTECIQSRSNRVELQQKFKSEMGQSNRVVLTPNHSTYTDTMSIYTKRPPTDASKESLSYGGPTLVQGSNSNLNIHDNFPSQSEIKTPVIFVTNFLEEIDTLSVELNRLISLLFSSIHACNQIDSRENEIVGYGSFFRKIQGFGHEFVDIDFLGSTDAYFQLLQHLERLQARNDSFRIDTWSSAECQQINLPNLLGVSIKSTSPIQAELKISLTAKAKNEYQDLRFVEVQHKSPFSHENLSFRCLHWESEIVLMNKVVESFCLTLLNDEKYLTPDFNIPRTIVFKTTQNTAVEKGQALLMRALMTYKKALVLQLLFKDKVPNDFQDGLATLKGFANNVVIMKKMIDHHHHLEKLIITINNWLKSNRANKSTPQSLIDYVVDIRNLCSV